MPHRYLLASVLAAAVISLAFLWLTAVPLGIAGEWEWRRIELGDGQTGDVLLGCVSAIVIALGYVVVYCVGAVRLRLTGRVETATWLTVAVVAGFFIQLALQQAPPAEHGLSKTPLVLYDPGASGYFYLARYEMQGARSFLSDYADRVSQPDEHGKQDVLHVGTHPPGLFLAYHWLIGVCRDLPTLSELLNATQPEEVDDGFDLIDDYLRNGQPRIDASDRAAIWLVALLTQLCGAATIVPLYLLLRRSFPARASWMAAAFWPLIPAVSMFSPKSDVIYPFLGMLFLYLWMSGWSRNSAHRCFASGLIFFFGATLSLAVLPYALLAAALTIWETRTRTDRGNVSHSLKETAVCLAFSVGAFMVAVGTCALAYDINLFEVWIWNYRNHAAFYDQFERTYWKWLLVNPIELALAVGLPVMILAVTSFWKATTRRGCWSRASFGPYVSCAGVWVLLWLSGKNSGEVARLWIVLMPWLIWLVAEHFGTAEDNRGSAEPIDERHFVEFRMWLLLLCVQFLVALLTVTRVSGFHFGNP